MQYNKETWIENFNLLTKSEDIFKNEYFSIYYDITEDRNKILDSNFFNDFDIFYSNLNLNILNNNQLTILAIHILDSYTILELEDYNDLMNIITKNDKIIKNMAHWGTYS